MFSSLNPLSLRTFLLAFILLSNAYKAQLTGNVLLEGQTNASGIKVKFTANSGTAVTDSCMTDTAGNFFLTISPGTYKIAYSKFGFHYVYNNATAQVLTNSTVLTSLTMTKGHATFISGNVSGAWSDTTVYYVTGDLVVVNNTSLTIPPGTKVKFLGYYKIISDGVLKAEGTSTKRILFTLQDSSVYWEKLDLNNDACVLHYCTVEYLMTGIVIHKNAEVSDCIVRKVAENGIAINYGRAKIVNNEIYDFKRYGIRCVTTSSLICNNIHHDRYQDANAASAGINVSDSSFILNNNVHHVSIGIQTTGNTTIKNNFLHNSSIMGIYCIISAYPYEGTQIINNTFLDHQGIAMSYQGANSSTTKFINNIMVNCPNGVNNITGTCEYNLSFNCAVPFNTVTSVGVGHLVAKNANGDSIDPYFNVFLDPDFTVNNPPFLQQGSPALNAGNSTYGTNIGADAALICYQNIITGLPTYAKADEGVQLFPNPNDGTFTLRLKNKAFVSIYDFQGKEISSASFENGEQQMNISAYGAGIYFIIIKEERKLYSLKFIKQ